MASRLTALMLAVLLSFWACGPAPTQQAGGGSDRPNAPAFTGTVRCPESSWGQAGELGDVMVSLYSIAEDSGIYSWHIEESTVSDTEGRFFTDSLAPGHYCLLFEKEGWMAFSGYLAVGENDTLADLDTVTLSGTQTVSGTIKDSAGRLGKDLILGLIGTPYFDTVSIRDNGIFMFRQIPFGNYKLEIKAFSLIDAVADTYGTDSVSALDSLQVHPLMVAIDVDVINVTSISSAGAVDTVYELGYDDLPGTNQQQVDSVKVSQSTVQVTNDAFSINYTVEMDP